MARAGLPRQDSVLRRPTGERPLAEVVTFGKDSACVSECGEACRGVGWDAAIASIGVD